MGDALLMLDGLSAPSHQMSKGLGRKIVCTEITQEAASQLEQNAENYAALLVEPFLYWQKMKQIGELHDFLVEARKHVPVIVYTTRDKGTVREKYQLQEGIHYDVYVSKSAGSPERMKTALEALVQ